jgi:hypothetical protein
VALRADFSQRLGCRARPERSSRRYLHSIENGFEVVTVEVGVITRNLDDFGDEALTGAAFQVNEKIQGVSDVALDCPIGKFDTTFKNATGEAAESLHRGVGVESRDGSRMPGVQQL